MLHYRIYLLGSNDNIVSALDEQLKDDAQAHEAAAAMAHEGQSVEVWQGKRYVCRFASLKQSA